MRCVWFCMICKKWSRAAASFLAGPRSVSTKPEIEASGVLSSWLALAMKSARMRSMRRASLWSLNIDDEQPGAAADRRDGDPVDALDRHALDIVDDARTRRCPCARARSPTASPGRGTSSAATGPALWRRRPTRGIVDVDGSACRVEDDQRIADGCRKALRRQAVQPAAVGRRGAVGLALASRAARREKRDDEEEKDGWRPRSPAGRRRRSRPPARRAHPPQASSDSAPAGPAARLRNRRVSSSRLVSAIGFQ